MKKCWKTQLLPPFLEVQSGLELFTMAEIRHLAVPFDRWRIGHGKTRNKPPYGWCFSQGDLIKDQREYPIVQLIESLWNQGRTVGEIVRYLNENGYRSRLNRDWGYGVIKGIIQRLQNFKGSEE